MEEMQPQNYLKKGLKMHLQILSAAIDLPKYNQEEFKQACEQVYFWQHSNGDSFSSQLLNLFAKADMNNSLRLASAYPELTKAFALWYLSDNENYFYKKYCSHLLPK